MAPDLGPARLELADDGDGRAVTSVGNVGFVGQTDDHDPRPGQDSPALGDEGRDKGRDAVGDATGYSSRGTD